HPQRPGQFAMSGPLLTRRDFLSGAAALSLLSSPRLLAAMPNASLGFRLVDVTAGAGIDFRHNSGAFGGKLLPETLGSGCAFLDYDGDGCQDILLITAWTGPATSASAAPCASIATIATALSLM